MATRPASSASQSDQSTQSAPVTRERQPLAPWAEQVSGHTVLRLTNVSFLPANGDKKATFGGLMAGYVDPVTGQPCHFEGRQGEVIAGGCPVRLFGGDAEQVITQLGGVRPGEVLLLGITADADAGVYRKDDGEVAYLAVSGPSLTGAYRWQPTIQMAAF